MKAVILALFLAGCTSIVKPLPNGCLANAAVYQAAYQQKQNLSPWSWTKILIVKWGYIEGQKVNAHALCVYQIQGPKLYAWDAEWSSRRVPFKYRDNPNWVAKSLYGDNFETAFYLEDEP